MNYITLPEIDNLLPRLSDDEFAQLKSSIETEGVREPIIIWRRESDNVLVDGHNRSRVCEELGINPPVAYHDFESVESAQQWVIQNQLGRRNISADWGSYLRGRLALYLDGTTENISAITGVSERTIYRDKKYSKAVDGIATENKKPVSEILELPRAETITLFDMPIEERQKAFESGAPIRIKHEMSPIELARRLIHKAKIALSELAELAGTDKMIGDMSKHILQLADDINDFSDELDPIQETDCPKCGGAGCDYCAGIGTIPGIIVAEHHNKKIVEKVLGKT